MKEIISRKEFIQRCALVGLAAVGGGTLISSCGGGGKSDESAGASHEASTETSSSTDPCSDTSSLSKEELQMRTSLKYTPESPEPGKHCENCKFYTAPEGTSPCGACTLFKGPVNPNGYCTSWFAADKG